MANDIKNNISQQSTSVNEGAPVCYMTMPAPHHHHEDDEINLLDYWRTLMRYKWMIVLITLIGASGAVIVAENSPGI